MSVAPNNRTAESGQAAAPKAFGVRHRVQPRLALRRRVVPQCAAGAIPQHLQMPGIAAVDALEVPRARDDFRVRFPRARSRLQQEERFHIDLSAAENLPFLRQRIGRNPHAVLQVAEAFVAQVAAQPFALGVLSRGHVEEQRDSLFTKGPSDVLDHATSEITSGRKLGIVALKQSVIATVNSFSSAPYSFNRSAALYARAQRSIAGGVNSGIRKMEAPVPLYFSHGHDGRLWDVDGNEYLDFQLGQGALLYGHAPAGMAVAIAEQARRGVHWAAQSELEIEVAERLQRMIRGAERVRFNSSATEVVLAAFRLARAHTGKPLILKFEGHYHGWGDEGLIGFAPSPDQWGSDDEPTRLHPSAGVIREVLDQFIVARWNDVEHLRRRVAQYRGQIAAIVCEPCLCNTGCIVLLRQACCRLEKLDVFEVETGKVQPVSLVGKAC